MLSIASTFSLLWSLNVGGNESYEHLISLDFPWVQVVTDIWMKMNDLNKLKMSPKTNNIDKCIEYDF